MPSVRLWCLLVGGFVFGLLGATGVLHVAGVSFGNRAPVAESIGAGLRVASERSATPAAPDEPTPEPTEPPFIAGQSLFATSQIVSYYGHPLSPAMGVLGEGSEDAMLERLKMQAAEYQALTPDKAVVPALHLVYEVAQSRTSDDGLYLYRTDDATVRHYIDLTRDQHMLLFLDLQIGRSSLKDELQYVLPYLREPQVHLAIDPEFVTLPGYRPGMFIGTLDCLQVNDALETIERMVEEVNLPNKIVIVHQFEDDMLTNKDKLRFDEPRVDTVLDMDGFGDQSGKLSMYDKLVHQFGAKYAGLKLFYKHDTGLLSPEQVEGLTPRPDVIIYQ
ncbi:MAG TPA: hypothetical protein VKV26_15545 [Dehalococcoidia bacterium]|nr:hypothetical protein [Dehalococcoidia bacterium]